MLWNIVSLKSTCRQAGVAFLITTTACKVLQGPINLQNRRKIRETEVSCFHKLTVSCGTTPIDFRRLSRVTFRISSPSIHICQEANCLDP